MKSALKLFSLYMIVAATLMSCATNQSIARTEAPIQEGGPHISFNVFYQSLSPYGRWISYPQYGQVWMPNAGSDFQPYSTNGHWVYSNYGWTWVSNYSWGWAPFHYGRWLFDNNYGWVWVPGQEWAPAWVAWRNSSDYYGWAPLGPGININVNIGIPAARWVFVPRHYFGGSQAYRYYIPRQQNVTIIHNTTIIRNVNVYQNNRYYTGPSRGEVQSATHRTVRPVRVFSAQQAGETRVSNRQLSIYRPTVVRTSDDSRIVPATNSNSPATNTHANSNKPQRVPASQRPVESNNPTRATNANARTLPESRSTPKKNTQRVISSPAPNAHTPAPKQRPTEVQRPGRALNTHSGNNRKPVKVQTRQQINRQNTSINKARPVQRDTKDANSSRPHRR